MPTGLDAPEDAGKRLTVLRAIDKLDRLGIDGVRLLLGEGRKDDSGDFTKGAGLSDEQIAKVLVLFEIDAKATAARDANPLFAHGAKAGVLSASAQEEIRARGIVAGLLDNLQASARGLEGAAELKEIWHLVSAGGYNDGRIRIDPSVVRGLEYYTGPVYEAELTFEVPNDDGQIVRFGSVGGGGRYDGLVSRFLPEPVPSTGFSIGVSRLMAALKAIKSPILGLGETHGPVVVLVMDKTEAAAYQALVIALRHAGIAAEMYLGASGMKAQMKYADRRKAPCVVIQGSNERENGVVQLKDLVEGARLSAGITDNKEWRESRPAQVTVPVSAMVGAVADILARYRTE